MCNQTMAPREYSSSDQSSSSTVSSFHQSLSDDENDCCGKSGSSLEDTLSLTCDESLTSSMSSSSITDNTIDDSSDTEIEMIYHSPHVLRRRLLPLAPSPITDLDINSIHRKPFDNKTLWKKRPSSRIIWFTLALVTCFLGATAVDYRWMAESLVVGANVSSESREWRRFLRRRAPKILNKLPAKSFSFEYTIRIKGHRVDLVTQSLDFHAQCPSVKDVQIEWTDKNGDLPPSLLKHKSGKVKPLGKSSTPAVFLLDEDLILSCEEIERAFREWRVDPSRLVGFYPFHHHEQSEASSSDFQLRPVSRGGSYSMVSDRAVFIHSLILRSIPTTPRECQHLGMSIIVSSFTSKPPVAVLSNPKTFQQSKRHNNVTTNMNQSCQQWVEAIGASKLPDQIATIVGKQQQS